MSDRNEGGYHITRVERSIYTILLIGTVLLSLILSMNSIAIRQFITFHP